MKKSWLVIGGIIAALIYLAVSQGVFTISPGEAMSTGGFISVPTYGYLKCQQSQNIVSSPATGWQAFDSKVIKCQDYGTLLQECDVTFKMPSAAELPSKTSVKNSALIYSVCTTGTPCTISQGDAANEIVYARSLFNDQEASLNKEITVRLGQNQIIFTQYLEAGVFGSASPVNRGKFSVNHKPWLVYRYDIFSLANGEAISQYDCAFSSSPNEANFIIEDVRGGGKLTTSIKESQYANLVSIRSREAQISYISNFIAVMPQYDIFADGTRYCYDKKVYAVEEIETPSGVYKVANRATNAELYSVECCNNGDVATGYYCKDFKMVKLADSAGQECSAAKPCPIVGYQPIPGQKSVYQECISGKCVSKTVNVACNYNEECAGGYCQKDPMNPAKNKCVSITAGNYCGNGVCEASRGETAQVCSKDCNISSGINSWLPWAVLGGSVLIAAALFVSKKRRR